MHAFNWAHDVFGDANLGDERRTRRLVQLAAAIADGPERSMGSNMGSEAANKAAQRFFGNDAFGYEDISAAVCDDTVAQFSQKRRVLLVQDTMHLNYDTHKKTIGLGHIGSTSTKSFQGIMMHWTLALDERAIPIGLAHLKLWERANDPRKKRVGGHQDKPIEQKESFKWIEGVTALDGRLPEGLQAIWLADRESDIYDFIDVVLTKGQDFVIRANCDRIIGDDEESLKDRARQAPIVGRQKLELRDRAGTLKSVSVNIRCCDAELVVQRRKAGAKTSRLSRDRDIHIVHVSSDDMGIEWILLTSLPVESLDDCLEVIWLYKQRWHIECVHKTLKSGFRAEDLTLASADRLECAIAVMLPCAIRIYWMAHLQKEAPAAAASSVLSKVECAILSVKNGKSQKYIPTIKEAWLWIGWMGGFRGSKGSAPPGQITFWRGFVTLKSMAAGAELFAGMAETQKCVQ